MIKLKIKGDAMDIPEYQKALFKSTGKLVLRYPRRPRIRKISLEQKIKGETIKFLWVDERKEK